MADSGSGTGPGNSGPSTRLADLESIKDLELEHGKHDDANDDDGDHDDYDDDGGEQGAGFFKPSTTWRDIGASVVPDFLGAGEKAQAKAKSSNEQQQNTKGGAPRYPIPRRRIATVEVPMLVENLDRAVRAFEGVHDKSTLLDPHTHTIPFYLNPESPWRQPITSHGAKTHNVVLKVTVPKRTGRRRKKGSRGPWEGEVEMGDATAPADEAVQSRSRLDDPRILRRKLEDNVGRYQVQAVGTVDTTHRFRGLSDFYWNLESSPFVQRFMSTVYTNDVAKMKEFSFVPGADTGPNVDIMPPPAFTNMVLPFNYFYSQNPYVQKVGEDDTINITLPRLISTLISADDPAPTGPKAEPDMRLPRTVEIMAELEEAFEERPIWTRRALLNRVGRTLPSWNEARKYTSFVSYQFKGGPWRDAMVRFGVDPRTDPGCRIYQTVMFQIRPDYRKRPREESWRDMRRGRDAVPREFDEDMAGSHVFDGQEYYTDGKVWQVCDITDPLLAGMLARAEVRAELSPLSGWYRGGLWAKAKAIMKTKLLAIAFDRRVRDADFARCLAGGDATPPRGAMLLPLPNLRLTDEEWFAMTGKRGSARRRHRVSAHHRSTPAASRKALEFFAAGGGLPPRPQEQEDDDDYDQYDDNGHYGLAIDPRLGIDMDMDRDVSMGMSAGGYDDYEQVEEEVNVGYGGAQDEGEDDDDYDSEELADDAGGGGGFEEVVG